MELANSHETHNQTHKPLPTLTKHARHSGYVTRYLRTLFGLFEDGGSAVANRTDAELAATLCSPSPNFLPGFFRQTGSPLLYSDVDAYETLSPFPCERALCVCVCVRLWTSHSASAHSLNCS